MAISIDKVYKKVLTFTNSDIRGNVKPSDARLAIDDVVHEIIDEYFADVNRLINRENRGLISGGLVNLPDRTREKILHFLKEDVVLVFETPYFKLPTDLQFIDSVFYQSNNEVEFCKDNKEFKLIANYADTKPTINYPIGLLVGDKIKIAPASINNSVTVSYLRKPKFANWTFTVIDGVELFNPSASDFQDIDLHPSEESNVVLRTLKRFGINLKENDLVAVTTNETAQDFNQENAS
jgi:hypothetical protein